MYSKDKDPGDNVSCPLCRQVFTIPEGGLSLLPNNFIVDKLKEVRKLTSEYINQENVMCEICSESNETDPNKSAKWQCLDCVENLFDQCSKNHQKSRSGKNHKVFEIGKENEHLLKIRPSFCEDHPDVVIKLYCTDDKQVICMKCVVIEHQNHRCEDINKMAETFRQLLQSDIDIVGQKGDECQKENDKAAKEKMSFLEHIFENVNKVNRKYKDLSKLLQSHANYLIRQLENEKGKALKDIELTKENINRELLMIESFKRYSHEEKDKATSADICRVAEDLHTRAKQLQDMKLTCALPSPIISFSPADAVEDLTKYQNLVGIVSIGACEGWTISGWLSYTLQN